MKKNKKRNELVIFEELRIKIPKKVTSPASSKDYKLEKPNILCAVNKKTGVSSLWLKKKDGKLEQVDEFFQPIYAASDSAEPYPKEPSLKKYNADMMVAVNRYGWVLHL